jgi:hypothetical protein
MPTLMTDPETRREQRLRSKARRQGYAIRKSRVRTPHLDDLGGFMILAHSANGISSNQGVVMVGSRFELDLDDVDQFLAER